jgi:hypothetical protein
MPATDAELFIPLIAETDPLRNDRETNFLRTFGRLTTVAIQDAPLELSSIERRLREQIRKLTANIGDARIRRYRDWSRGGEFTGSTEREHACFKRAAPTR